MAKAESFMTFSMRCMQAFLGLLLLALSAVAGASEAEAVWHSLDYIAVDYPPTVSHGQVVDEGEYAEQLEFARHLVTAIADLPARPGRDALLAQVRQLLEQIQSRADGPQVAHTAREAAQRLVDLYGVRVTPRITPDLKLGARLFQDKCSGCHGTEGRGDGPQAARLDPPPINFHDRERALERSVYGLYSTITLGVEGTAMRPFRELSEAQRWALAFHVANLAFTDQERRRGAASWREAPLPQLGDLERLVNMTPAEAAALDAGRGPAQLAYLRSHPELLMPRVHPLDVALEKLADSMASYGRGEVKQAYRDAVSAYLDGFELAEATLRVSNPRAMKALEARMMAYRQLIRDEAPRERVEAAYQALVQDLRALRAADGRQLSTGAGATGAAVILLREGLEAILILAAIAGVLIKTGRRDLFPYLHVGWIAALVLGGVTWLVSSQLLTISGGNRELTEGLTALLATAVLVYVGFWLHGKTNARRWREFVHSKIHGAVEGRTLWALTAVAFLAVYREVFETVLFYQALWVQTAPAQHPALWGGIGVGLGLLGLLGWLILRFSMRLPLRLLFNVNSFIMFILAVTFSGHGVAALQKAGLVSATSIPLPSIELLGIYPTVETALAQLLVACLIVGILVRERISARPGPVAA